jgi:hypothetical protein
LTNQQETHRSIASLKLPRRVGALITYAQAIVTGMTNNPSFPSPVPTLVAVGAAIGALQTAETGALARTKGTVATRNEKRKALVALLEPLRAYVQTVADANPENGPSIIQSAGMSVRKSPTHPARAFTAKAGAVSGTVKLHAVTVGHRAAYLWEYSVDGGKTWIAAPVTLQAKTLVTGLTAGATVQFRYQPVSKTGGGDWSQVIAFLVK